MDAQQRAAAIRLLSAVEKDPRLMAESRLLYGDWYKYLYDHLIDHDKADEYSS